MIYYVEDDANIRELVIYTLNQTGLAAKGFSDAPAFFAASAEEKPTVITSYSIHYTKLYDRMVSPYC